MQTLADIISKQQRADLSKDDLLVTQLMGALIETAEEVCVQRDRVDTCLKLAAAGLPLSSTAIDQYAPTPDETAARLKGHTTFFEELFSGLDSASESP